MKRIALIALLFLVPSLVAHEDDQIQLTPEQEKFAKQLETELIAPCCWRQPVSEHHSPAADEVRAEIRKLVAEGQEEKAILARFTSQYGARILSSPPTQGFNWLAWVLPFAALAIGGLGVVIYVRSRQPDESAPIEGQAPSKASSTASSGDQRYARMLEDELKEV